MLRVFCGHNTWKSPSFEVSSETWGNVFTGNTHKIRREKLSTHVGTYYLFPFQRGGIEHSEEILDQSETEVQQGKRRNPVASYLMSEVLDNSPLQLCCLWHTSFSLASSTLCVHLYGQISQGYLKLFGSPIQFRLHFYSFMLWPLRGSTQGSTCAIYLASVAPWKHRGRFHDSFTQVSFMTLNPAPYQRHCQVLLPARACPFESRL